ncbi:hypothetical protein DPU05_14650 [Salmonella enterica subsp. enterica serovar Teddington]|nr:hypothetical protein [Salmonella enterica]EBW5579096.1 hypothetical protein [Salmonella enterica subsp. enterica serovar Teddington]
MKISLNLRASDASIKPIAHDLILVEVDGVELERVINEIDDHDAILKTIGDEYIADWACNNKSFFDFLGHFDIQEIADYLETQGWKASPAAAEDDDDNGNE